MSCSSRSCNPRSFILRHTRTLTFLTAIITAVSLTTATAPSSFAATTTANSHSVGSHVSDSQSALPQKDASTDLDALAVSRHTPHSVAIGDSYTTASFDPADLWEPCIRNVVDYPHLVAATTGLPLVEPACIGATGSGYWYPSRVKGTHVTVKAAYRDKLNKHTALATINLGLNDIMLAYHMKLVRECFAAAYTNTNRRHSACQDRIDKTYRSLIAFLPLELEGIYRDAKERISPNGMVIAIGYAEMFTPGGPCWDNVLIGPADRAYINHVFKGINRAVRLAAHKAHVYSYIPGDHQIRLTSTCGLPFLRWASSTGFPEVTYPMHPTFAAAVTTAYAVSKIYLSKYPRHSRLTSSDIAPRE